MRLFYFFRLLPITLLLALSPPVAGQVVISEFMADNASTFEDLSAGPQDDAFPDWIEITNTGDTAVNLLGYKLRDSTLEWPFPSAILDPGAELVVFASGRNLVDPANPFHTNFTLASRGEFLALVKPDSTFATVFSPEYPPQEEDVSYGTGLVGTELTVDLTPEPPVYGGSGAVLDEVNYAQIRPSESATSNAKDNLNTTNTSSGLRYLWSNYASELGKLPQTHTEVVSAVLEWEGTGRTSASIQWTTGNIGVFEVPDDERGRTSIFSAPVTADSMVNYYAANPPIAEATFLGNSELLTRTWDVTPLVSEWIANPSSPRRGQMLFLNNVRPMWVNWSTFVPKLTVVVADQPDVQPPFVFFLDPTPGDDNNNGVVDFVGDTRFDFDRGFYDAPFMLEISTSTPDATILYTTDGQTPDAATGVGTLYTAPIPITATTVVRARAFRSGWAPSNTDTQTYVFLDDVVEQDVAHAVAQGFPAPEGNADDAFVQGENFIMAAQNEAQKLEYGMKSSVVSRQEELVKAALGAIPMFSLTLDQKFLTDPNIGMYVNAHNRSIEHPGSLELLNENGSMTGSFQIDCGVRVRGGFSRRGNNPKHAFRFVFRREYGATRLDYPLFGDEGASSFDRIDLRTPQNYSWSFHNDRKNTFLREVLARDAQLATGQPSTRSRYYHLVLNGHYWGIFMTQERAGEDYAASYFGGSDDDYDTLKSVGNGGTRSIPAVTNYTLELADGTIDAWQSLWQEIRSLRNDATPLLEYYELQGLEPDGVTPKAGTPVLLDVDNLIDYLLVIFYSGNHDAPLSTFVRASNNWFAVRNRVTADEGFRYFVHDGEHSFGTDFGINGTNGTLGIPNNQRTTDRTGPFGGSGNNFKGETMHNTIGNFTRSNPQYFHEDLAFVDEYRVRFADRVYKHLITPGGALTDERIQQMLDARVDKIEGAILAESARWGGTSNETVARWAAELQRLRDWINAGSNALIGTSNPPGRADTIVSQLRAYRSDSNEPQPLYPSIDPPVLSQAGGQVPAGGITLTMTNPNGNGTIYYRADGLDPRASGGGVRPGSTAYSGSIPISTFTSVMARVLNSGTNEWSALNEAIFVLGVAPSSSNVAVTEINYRPADPNQTEINDMAAMGLPAPEDDDFEYIEIMNISATDPVDFSGVVVSYDQSPGYTFPDNFALQPKEIVLIARNPAALQVRYTIPGPTRIVGPVDTRLSSGGEQIALTQNTLTFLGFTYDNDNDGWPNVPSNSGLTISLIAPETAPDHGDGLNWRTGSPVLGNPGTLQGESYADWATRTGVGGTTENPDGDLLNNFLEYAFGGDPNSHSGDLLPTANNDEVPFELSYYRSLTATGVSYDVEISTDLVTWQDGNAAAVIKRVDLKSNNTEKVEIEWIQSMLPPGDSLYARIKTTQL